MVTKKDMAAIAATAYWTEADARVVVAAFRESGQVDGSDRYEPGLQRSYEEMARRHSTAVIAARRRIRATTPRSRSPSRSRLDAAPAQTPR